MPQMTEFAVKDIKIVITESHRFRKLEENINVQSRNMEDKKMAQSKLLEMKTIMFEMKTTHGRVNSRTGIAENQIRALEYITIQVFQNETYREQRLKIK